MRSQRRRLLSLFVARYATVTVLLPLTLTLVLDGYAFVPPQEAAAPAGRSVVDGVFSARQARRGERRFVQFCEQCHRTRDFTSVDFLDRWTGQTVGDLLGFVQNTMPPDNPGSLSADRYTDVLAYLLGANDYPAGEEELPSDPLALMDVRIEPAPEKEAAQSEP